jgi:hypothetical protein
VSRSRLLLARADQVADGIDLLGIDGAWHTLLAIRAEHESGPSSAVIIASFTGRDTSWGADLLDGLSISEISVLYEYSLAYVDRHSRKLAGQFFTPDDVARFLATRAALFPAGTWIDPCCGVGNLSWWLAEAQPNPERFVADRLVLVDRDPLALRIACALIALEFERSESIWAALTSRSQHGDALTDELPAFDFAILNPPYLLVPRDDRFRAGEARDLYAYFIERMVTNGHGIVAISPQSFTSGRKFAEFRRMLVDNLAVMDVYCFDNVPDNVFRGIKFGSQNTNRVNSTRAAVLIGHAGDRSSPAMTDPSKRRHRITPLLRWRTRERGALFAAADTFLAPLQPDAERAFPKVGASLIPLHSAILACEATVGDLMVTETTPFPLDVPATPRYFLSAVKRQLERTSSHRLHFATAADRDRAYIVLNSSVGYWWWRVYEGGITVSKSTLASLPLSLKHAPAPLVSELEASERENVVVKQNAGRANENVKHPWPLLRQLNRAVAPDFADELMAVHANSHVTAGERSALDRDSPVLGL